MKTLKTILTAALILSLTSSHAFANSQAATQSKLLATFSNAYVSADENSSLGQIAKTAGLTNNSISIAQALELGMVTREQIEMAQKISQDARANGLDPSQITKADLSRLYPNVQEQNIVIAGLFFGVVLFVCILTLDSQRSDTQKANTERDIELTQRQAQETVDTAAKNYTALYEKQQAALAAAEARATQAEKEAAEAKLEASMVKPHLKSQVKK